MSSTTKNFSAVLQLIQHSSPLKSNEFTKKIRSQNLESESSSVVRNSSKTRRQTFLSIPSAQPSTPTVPDFPRPAGRTQKKPQLHCRLRFSFFSGTRGYLTQYSTLSKNPSAVSEELRSPRRRRHVPSFSPVYSFTSAGTANSNEYSFHSGSSFNMISL